jgi:hypothetical protein
MSGQTTLSFWQLLALSVGPVTLTALVAFVGPMLLERRKQQAEARKRRAEKLEELIETLYQHDHWLESTRDKYTFGNDIKLDMAPLMLAQALVLLHFPSLKEKMDELFMAARRYEAWCIKAGRMRVAKEANFTDGFDDVYQPYLNALGKMVSTTAEFGRKELGS